MADGICEKASGGRENSAAKGASTCALWRLGAWVRDGSQADKLGPVRPIGIFTLLTLSALAIGCAGRENPGLIPDGLVDGGTSDVFEDDFDPNKPPPPDASGLCGNEIIETRTSPPTLYFVIDRSGSMADVSNGQSKYISLEIAVVDLVRRIGSRAKFGAAVFPGLDPDDSCRAGEEVFSPKLGDSLSFVDSGADGPVTRSFADAIHMKPNGGTPTGPTLEKLFPNLTALDGKVFVVLATDGGPNCNPAAQCSALTCIPNIEGAPGCVDSTRNCCSKDKYGPVNCLDASRTTGVVRALFDAGIRTYVVGLPGAPGDSGTDIYGWLLEEMATAGGTARSESPKYFAVKNMVELRDVIGSIGAEVIATCDFTLEEEPLDPGKVNVYFDTDIVPRDAKNGWDWTGATSLSLRGEACKQVKSGSVGQVQIVVGCPTQMPQ